MKTLIRGDVNVFVDADEKKEVCVVEEMFIEEVG